MGDKNYKSEQEKVSEEGVIQTKSGIEILNNRTYYRKYSPPKWNYSSILFLLCLLWTYISIDKVCELPKALTVLLPIFYLVVFVVGLPSNLLALWVLLFRTKKQPSTILLINLTTCDLLLLVALPFRISYHFQGNDWTLGEYPCRIVMALFYGNMYGSVLCLALIAFDRYLALVHPITGGMLRSSRTSVYMSVAVWVVVLAAMAPLLATKQTYFRSAIQSNITTCHDVLPIERQLAFFVPYFTCLFTVCFLLPLLVVLFCYSSILYTLMKAGKRYKHAVHVTVLVMVVFLVFLLPSNLLLLLHNSELKQGGDNLYTAYMVTLALSTFNSCLDPFIFYYVSEDFRERAQQVLRCRETNHTINTD